MIDEVYTVTNFLNGLGLRPDSGTFPMRASSIFRGGSVSLGVGKCGVGVGYKQLPNF